MNANAAPATTSLVGIWTKSAHGDTGSRSVPATRSSYLLPFSVLLAGYCLWILSLPVFPSHDSAMHLYYIDVIQRLLEGNQTYRSIYALRYPLPPYTGQYVLLLALKFFSNAVLAEKMGVCIILLSTAFGFRFLARTLGESGALFSLWIIPLLLNWPLFMGFHSFCLSLSFALWSLGLWFRVESKHSYKAWIAFLLSAAAVMFTHPVPLLFELGFIASHMGVRLIFQKSSAREHLFHAALAATASSFLLYIALFVKKSGVVYPVIGHQTRAEALRLFASLHYITYASGGVETKLLRLALYLLLLGSLAIAANTLRAGATSPRMNAACATWFGFACLMAVALPFLPSHMNGLDYFSERLMILIWIAGLAAACSHKAFSKRVQVAIAAGAFVVALLNLALADWVIRPVAKSLAYIEQVPVHPAKLGLILPAEITLGPSRVNFDPYGDWNAVRYFRRSNTVLLNDPWSTAPNILPVTRPRNSLNSWLPEWEATHPKLLHDYLLQCPKDRKRLLGQVDSLIFLGLPASQPPADPLLALDPERTWHCQQHPWFFVCWPNKSAAKSNSVDTTDANPSRFGPDLPFLRNN